MDNTSTPTQPAEKTAQQQAMDARQKQTRLVRFVLPQIDGNSALLPTDKWALDAIWDFAKKNKSFHKTAGGMAGFAAGALATVVLGTTAAFMVAGAVPIAAVAVATVAVAGFMGKKVHDFLNLFRQETLPALRADIGKKYLDLKMTEMKAAWQKKKDALDQKRAAEKAQAPTPVVAVETPKVDVKAEVKVETPAPVAAAPVPSPEKKTEDKQSIGGAIGNFLLKKAMEAASKKKPAEQQDNTPPAIKKDPPPPKAAA